MSFAADFARFQIGAIDKATTWRRGIIIALFSAIIKDTPVLSGRLRGNWQTSVGSPKLDAIAERGGSTPGVVPSELFAEIEAALSELSGDDAIYIRNNLPYAARVEFDGWSHTKAPAGMFRVNVERFRNNLAAYVAGGAA